jgi:hypothetical protein
LFTVQQNVGPSEFNSSQLEVSNNIGENKLIAYLPSHYSPNSESQIVPNFVDKSEWNFKFRRGHTFLIGPKIPEHLGFGIWNWLNVVNNLESHGFWLVIFDFDLLTCRFNHVF